MNLVPPEIWLQVFEYVGGPAPSEIRLHDQPSLDLLTTKPVNVNQSPSLKAVALVSRSWRSLVLPCLFRHVLWRPDVHSLSAFTLNPIPLLRFLTDNRLARGVITFTLVIDFHDATAADYQVAPQIRNADLEWLWDQLFSVIDPLRFTILARPTTLAALLSCMLYLNDAWSFDIPYHIFSLARTTRQIITESDGVSSITSARPQSISPAAATTSRRLAPPRAPRSRATAACPLFTVRPWTSLLLNEGSSTKVYRGYEFYLRRPPSILGALLGCEEYPNNVPLIPQSIIDFNYIAIFPLASHFEILVEHLPKVDRLFVQLMPKPGNNVLEDSDEIKHIDPNDPWLEQDTSYAALVRKLTGPASNSINWGLLRVFESGDAADQETAEMIFETEDWKVKRPGVFTRITDDEFSGWSDKVNGHVGGISNAPHSNLQ
ncbi:hypothetical protein F4678DRAFT_52728 [Xylaria arbuscula]|nr:hypothetical protein F4678DRAFT_52728 [Xylaria arbuscula]